MFKNSSISSLSLDLTTIPVKVCGASMCKILRPFISFRSTHITLSKSLERMNTAKVSKKTFLYRKQTEKLPQLY